MDTAAPHPPPPAHQRVRSTGPRAATGKLDAYLLPRPANPACPRVIPCPGRACHCAVVRRLRKARLSPRLYTSVEVGQPGARSSKGRQRLLLHPPNPDQSPARTSSPAAPSFGLPQQRREREQHQSSWPKAFAQEPTGGVVGSPHGPLDGPSQVESKPPPALPHVSLRAATRS